MALHHSWQGHYMEPTFMSFVGWCTRTKMEQYVAETGDTMLVGEATGVLNSETLKERYLQRFVNWCESVFGTPDDLSKKSFREAFTNDAANLLNL